MAKDEKRIGQDFVQFFVTRQIGRASKEFPLNDIEMNLFTQGKPSGQFYFASWIRDCVKFCRPFKRLPMAWRIADLFDVLEERSVSEKNRGFTESC